MHKNTYACVYSIGMLLRCNENFILYKICLIIVLLLTTVHKLFTISASSFIFISLYYGE